MTLADAPTYVQALAILAGLTIAALLFWLGTEGAS